MPKTIYAWGVFGCIGTTLAIIAGLLLAKLTPFETALLGVILSAVSAVVSWLVTHYYYEQSKAMTVAALKEDYRENLRTFALKAAEKVSNLSNELNILATYIDNIMETSDEIDANTALLLNEQKLVGIVHIVRTLKSVNDTSLSDWGGVIGEELERKKQEEARREDQLEGLLGQLNAVLKSGNDLGHQSDVLNVLGSIKLELKSLGSQFRTSAPLTVPKRHEPVLLPCPACGEQVSIARSKKGRVAVHAASCGKCKTRLVVEPLGENHESAALSIRKRVPENVVCPGCGKPCTVLLDNFSSASTIEKCPACNHDFQVSRSPKAGLRTELYSPEVGLVDEQTLEMVRAKLPPQPWEKGIHKKIAEELNVANTTVQDAIQVLIQKGVFKEQRNGVLYEKVS